MDVPVADYQMPVGQRWSEYPADEHETAIEKDRMKSGVGSATVKDFELSGSDPKMGTVQKWMRTLEAAGVRFVDADEQDGPGVRHRGAKGKR